MKMKSSIINRVVGVIMALAMVLMLLPVTASEARAALPDQTINCKIPDKVYNGISADAIEPGKTTLGYNSIVQSITTVDNNRITCIDIYGAQLKLNNTDDATFKVVKVSDSSDFRIYWNNNGLHNSLLSLGDNVDSYNGMLYGLEICILHKGTYSITFEDITSGDHEQVTLNITATGDTKGRKYRDANDSTYDDIIFDNSVDMVVPDYGRDGSEFEAKVSTDSSSYVKYINDVYYLSYGSGSDVYLLSFSSPLCFYDWTGSDISANKLIVESAGSGIKWTGDSFQSGYKFSEYNFDKDEIELDYDDGYGNFGYYEINEKNNLLFKITAPINGIVKIPVTFYDNDGNEFKSYISVTTDSAPAISDDSSETTKKPTPPSSTSNNSSETAEKPTPSSSTSNNSSKKAKKPTWSSMKRVGIKDADGYEIKKVTSSKIIYRKYTSSGKWKTAKLSKKYTTYWKCSTSSPYIDWSDDSTQEHIESVKICKRSSLKALKSHLKNSEWGSIPAGISFMNGRVRAISFNYESIPG